MPSSRPWPRCRTSNASVLAAAWASRSADYHDSLSAGVAEISLDQKTGKIKVHNYWVAADPGLVIQPDHVHAQLESAVVYGLSAALIEEFAVKDGTVQAIELRQLSRSCA